MKKLLYLVLVIVLHPCLSQSSKADSLLNYCLDKSNSIGMVAGFSKGGNRQLSAAGYANLDEKNRMTTDTRIRLASVSKTITAVALMQLIENGEIMLDDRAIDYLDNLPSHFAEVTIRHLLNHSSGVRSYESPKERRNYKEYASLAAATEIFKDDDLVIAPGSDYSYTTYGYVLLGLILENVSGLTFGDYLKKYIFQPVGMNSTGIERIENISSAQSAVYHKNSKGKVKEEKRSNLSDRVPGGGIYSTVGDMLLFGEALLNNELISEASFVLMRTDSGLKKEGNPYGMGLFLYGENPKYGNVVGHGGAQLGASVQFMILPEINAVTFVAANTSRVWEETVSLSVFYFQLANEL